MAERVRMSPRNFARAFRAQIGVTPGRYVEQCAIEARRRALEETSEPVDGIARACGFGSAEAMRGASCARSRSARRSTGRFHSSFTTTRTDRRGHAPSAGEPAKQEKGDNR